MPFTGSVRAAYLEVIGGARRIIIDALGTPFNAAIIMFFLGKNYPGTLEDEQNVARIYVSDQGDERTLTIIGPGISAPVIDLRSNDLIPSSQPSLFLSAERIFLNTNDIVGPWEIYNLIATQGVGVGVSGASTARYMRVGHTITVQLELVCSSAGTNGQIVEVNLPIPPRHGTSGTSIMSCGSAYVSASTGQIMAMAVLTLGSTKLRFIRSDNFPVLNFLGADPVLQLLPGSIIGCTVTYEF